MKNLKQSDKIQMHWNEKFIFESIFELKDIKRNQYGDSKWAPLRWKRKGIMNNEYGMRSG